MVYKISLAIFQTNPDTHFRVVEQTVMNLANGGAWGRENERLVLTLRDSGNSGTLRFLADNGESFLVAVGVHNYKRWTDIVPNLKNDQTGVILNPQYYSQKEREQQRERQLSSFEIKNARGRQLAINYTQDEGENLAANIIIG